MSPTEEIKSRLNLVEFIGSYVRLQKTGANFKACCPFHNEKTPSFVVSPARQIWHCFGCGKGGDAFRFVMETEGMDFGEALRMLAERTGVVLRKENPELRSERARLALLMETAAEFFEKKLLAHKDACQYLKNRGLQEETIHTWRIGYAPHEWQELTTYLIGRGFRSEELERAGVALRSQASAQSRTGAPRYYDRFRGRIMFPIFDYQGRVVAFGGRIFPDRADEAKYINSPETPLYQKSKILYGLDRAKSEIMRSGTAVVVEGYMDTVMAHQAGTRNVVASSGTALGEDQLRMLRRLAERLVVSFDMDSAGQAAADRGVMLALKDGFEVKVVDLGTIKDPADAIQKDVALWEQAYINARHIVQFYLDRALRIAKPSTPEGKRLVESTVLPVVAALSSELERAHWVGEISRVLGLRDDIIWQALSRLQKNNPTVALHNESATPAHTERSRKDLLEERIIGMLARAPHRLQTHTIQHDFFSAWRKEAILAFGAGIIESPLKDAIAHVALEVELFLENVPDENAEFEHLLKELNKENLKGHLGLLAEGIKQAEAIHDPRLNDLLGEFHAVARKLAER